MKSINVNVENDFAFLDIVSDILANKEFQKLSNCVHHNSNRLQHSLNVSYKSYKVSRKLNLDWEKVSRAALLHDFFLEDNMAISKRKRLEVLFNHPSYALNNSMKYFELSDLEKDIILSHMFPIGKNLPRHKESLLVDVIDDYVSICEATYEKGKQFGAAFSFLIIFAYNIIFK